MKWKNNQTSKYKKILDAGKNEKRNKIHSFHRYYGKLIPAIPKVYIQSFTKENDLIGDLFSGSGTVAVEAKLLNRNFVGTEINPLSHFISQVKTFDYNVELLKKMNKLIEIELTENYDFYMVKKNDIPYCINIEHWFKENVINDLVVINKVVHKVVEENINDFKIEYIHFYLGIISSIIRNVSNADPRHVFPGFSKRMRKLEAEGKNEKDAIKTFIRSLNRKSTIFEAYDDKNVKSDILLGSALDFDILKPYKNKVSLFVTNPPYISSVRYIETVKLEMYWLEYIKSSQEYTKLARTMLGNDNILKSNIDSELLTSYDSINKIISEIRKTHEKDAHVVAKYFNDMEIAIKNMNKMLKLNGKVVVKISDSNVKKIKVETGKFLTEIALNNGFLLVDVFDDKINNNSRSLTLARNSYSNIILSDNIIIWEKKNEI